MKITLNTSHRDALAKVVQLYDEGEPVVGTKNLVVVDVNPVAVRRQMTEVKEAARIIELTFTHSLKRA